METRRRLNRALRGRRATGIIVAAVVVALLGLPMWQDLIIEYVAGFLFGLLIFQALFMRRMMGGTYLQNVRRSFMPELISMNCMMAGMAPVMVALMMGRDMRAMWPGEPLFWMVMSLGVIASFAIAYPVNVWMVSRCMKHGLTTERSAAEHAANGKAGKRAKPDGKQAAIPTGATSAHDGPSKPRKSGMKDIPGMEGMHHSGAARMSASGASTAKAGKAGKAGKAADAAPAMAADVTRPQLVAVTIFTGLMLLLGMTFPAAFYNLSLSAEDVAGAIMPPGMIMDNDTPAGAMRDMAAVDPRDVSRTVGLSTRCARELAPRIENGVKVFDLETSVIRWQILPDTWVDAYAFNGQVPGPTLRIRQVIAYASTSPTTCLRPLPCTGMV